MVDIISAYFPIRSEYTVTVCKGNKISLIPLLLMSLIYCCIFFGEFFFSGVVKPSFK